MIECLKKRKHILFYFKLNHIKTLKYEIIDCESYILSSDQQVQIVKVVSKSHTNFHDH